MSDPQETVRFHEFISALAAGQGALGEHQLVSTYNSAEWRITVQQIVDLATSFILDSAPSALDTLNELAAALGDDENFATTVNAALAARLAAANNLSDVESFVAARSNLGVAPDSGWRTLYNGEFAGETAIDVTNLGPYVMLRGNFVARVDIDNTVIGLRFSTDDGISWDDGPNYRLIRVQGSSSGDTIGSALSRNEFNPTFASIGNAPSEYVSAQFDISRFNKNAFAGLNSTAAFVNYDGTEVSLSVNGRHSGASARNGCQLYMPGTGSGYFFLEELVG